VLGMVRIDHLSVSYETGKDVFKAIVDINLFLEESTIYTLVGPSGCGKTTLIYAIAGLINPTEGAVYVNQKRVVSPLRDTAVILQDFGLFPWKTVEQNIALGLKLRRENPANIKSIVDEVLDKLFLKPFKKHYPEQLSGGQRQRVAIGRALALSPSLLLMDEPFSSLDALTREVMQNELLQLCKRKSMTAMLVTHSIEEAVYLGEQIIIMSKSPGRIVDIIHNPAQGNRENESFYKTTAKVRHLLQGYD